MGTTSEQAEDVDLPFKQRGTPYSVPWIVNFRVVGGAAGHPASQPKSVEARSSIPSAAVHPRVIY